MERDNHRSFFCAYLNARIPRNVKIISYFPENDRNLTQSACSGIQSRRHGHDRPSDEIHVFLAFAIVLYVYLLADEFFRIFITADVVQIQ
mgnify:CR=1 FL=1